MSVVVSVIICTRDRALSLRQTLAAMARVEVPADLGAELVVVDNGSSDQTCQAVAQRRLMNMPVRYVHEPRAGKGYAYNTGMAAAHGEVFLFTDDDVRPPSNWIEGMCRPIIEGEADAVAGGVKIAPHLERPWLQGDFRGWVGSTSGPVDVRIPGHVVGANMAFGRRVLEKVPGFDVELGPGALGFYDEALFWRQLLVAGYRVAGAPDTVVEHHFDPARLTPDSFYLTAEKLGRSLAYFMYHWEHRDIKLARLRWMYHALCFHWYRWRPSLRRRCGPDLGRLSTAFRRGEFGQFLQERRRPRNYMRKGLTKLAGVIDLPTRSVNCEGIMPAVAETGS